MIKDFTLSVNFSQQTSNTFRNLLSKRQVSPVEINGSIEADQLILYGKKFGDEILSVKYASLQEVKIESYQRIVPVASVGVNLPANINFICLKLLTKKGFLFVLETRDYDSLISLLNNLDNHKVNIIDVYGLKQIIINKKSEEIDKFLNDNLKSLAEKNNLASLRSGYLNK